MKNSEIILNADGSVYHLGLMPDEIAPIIITVGDPDRVEKVSKHLDMIEMVKHRREFRTHTGLLHGQRISIMSTGIGTDNIDIVFNELNLLFNYDFANKKWKKTPIKPVVIRIGTSGAIQPDIKVDTFLKSVYAVGFDGLMNFYNYQAPAEVLSVPEHLQSFNPYLAAADKELMFFFNDVEMASGVTLTANGFYAPQGRNIDGSAKHKDLIQDYQHICVSDMAVTNIEMETAGIYALASLFGFRALSLSAILANRATTAFSEKPDEATEALIKKVVEKLSELHLQPWFL